MRGSDLKFGCNYLYSWKKGVGGLPGTTVCVEMVHTPSRRLGLSSCRILHARSTTY